MASNVRLSLEQASALSRPLERAGRVPCDPKAVPRIRVSTIRPSQNLRPLERATFVSSCFFDLRSRSSLIRCMHNSEFTEPQAFESRWTATALELFRQAAPLMVSHPFVARGGALDGRGVAHADRFAALAAVASHVSPRPERARRRARPPVLRPPTAPALTIA